MKLSNLVYAAVGYMLGARAGRERYEDDRALARRVAGSQTVQSTAGVVAGAGSTRAAVRTARARSAAPPQDARADAARQG